MRRSELEACSQVLEAAGVDRAVESVFGGTVSWFSEINPAASKVLAYHYPGTPNLGSVTDIDWATVPPVDILCGGFPCTDVSAAGKRAGMHGTRSGLWSHMAEAIDVLRPRYVVIENVRGLLNANANRPMESAADAVGDRDTQPVLRAIGAVLGDLADLGTYDARWVTVSAASIGAPHRRERVFIVATDASGDGRSWGAQRDLKPSAGIAAPQRDDADRRAMADGRNLGCAVSGGEPVDLLPTPTAQDGNGGGRYSRPGHQSTLPGEVRLLPTPRSSDCFGAGHHGDGGMDLRTTVTGLSGATHSEVGWGKYEPAIRRWERVLGRPAPAPTEPNKNGNPRLAAEFSSWLMGWPAGWVTDPAIGISRNDQLRIVGNGVCPQQAASALRYLIEISEVAA